MFDITTEAMASVLQSKLGKQLDALWQKVIDYRRDQLKDMSPKAQKDAIQQYFHANIVRPFMDIVYKETGLWINRVEYVTIKECGFATCIFIGNDDDPNYGKYGGTLWIKNIQDGGFTERTYHTKIPENLTPEQLIKLAESYDSTKGAIYPKLREEIKKICSANFYFDITTGFLMDVYLPKNGGIEPLTAQELTAIVLHELGHTLTMVEHAADVYSRISTYRYLEDQVTKGGMGSDPKQVIKLAKLAAEASRKRGRTDAADKTEKMIADVEKAITTPGLSPTPQNVGTVIAGLFTIAFALINDIFILPLHIVFGHTNRYNPNDQKVKSGDIPFNTRLINWQERKADEYAFSHGYGRHIVTGLEKLHEVFARYGYSSKDLETIKKAKTLHKDISWFVKLQLIVLAPVIYGDMATYLYPPAEQRFKEMLDLLVQSLKAHGADPEYVKRVLADIERVRKAIDDFDKENSFTMKVRKTYDLFMSYLRISNWVDVIVHGRVLKEIEKLVTDIRGLNNNMLAYYGFKLQQISKA